MKSFGFGRLTSSKQKLKASDLVPVSKLGKTRGDDGFYYVDIAQKPIEIGGIARPEDNYGEYYRLDASKKADYSDANRGLAANTSGACVRFATNAEEISLRVTIRAGCFGMHHFCDRGVYGVDAYIGTGSLRRYVGGQMQTFADSRDVNAGTLSLGKGVKEVMVNMPLYAGISKMEIGFKKGARVGAPTVRDFKPVAFYGSSITQGGCVSRPGNSYSNIICRALNADCRNFGFSGSAMGEPAVAEYIAKCDLSCFVMDYDYNAPSVEHLKATHEKFFKIIRKAQPDLPVVFVTHPFYTEKPTEGDLARIAAVRETYEKALASGDKNVYFVDSRDYFAKDMRDLYAVDNLHPNDLGQMEMAKTVFPAVKKALNK
ncbi:MAG: hypothetical protein J5793_00685 [Clostridia bacterium]|nr:hypothetical protein [Clostridia bacterium]